MFQVKYVDSIMMLIVSLFQHKCQVSETVPTTTLHVNTYINVYFLLGTLSITALNA